MRQSYFAAALAVYLGAGFTSAARNSTNVSQLKPSGAVSAGSSQGGLKQLPSGQQAVAASEQLTQGLKPIPGSVVDAATLQPLKSLATTAVANAGSNAGALQTLSVTTTTSQAAVLVASSVCVTERSPLE